MTKRWLSIPVPAAASLVCSLCPAQVLEEQPGPSVERAFWSHAEQVVFRELGVAQPPEPISFSFEWIDGDGQGPLYVRVHSTPASFGPSTVLGAFFPSQIYTTPRAAYVGMAVSVAHNELGARRSAYMSGYFLTDTGPIHAVVASEENYPAEGAPYARLNVFTIVATSDTQEHADQLAGIQAHKQEQSAAAGWAQRGFPAELLPAAGGLAATVEEPISAPPQQYRAVLSSLPFEDITESCYQGFDWDSGFFSTDFNPSGSILEESDFYVGVSIRCMNCVGVPSLLCRVCDPAWDVDVGPYKVARKGKYQVSITHREFPVAVPCAQGAMGEPCNVEFWRMTVRWTVEVVEYFPLGTIGIYNFDNDGQPANYVWRRHYHCVNEARCASN